MALNCRHFSNSITFPLSYFIAVVLFRSPAEREVQSVSNQLSSVRNQISIGVNMIVAIVATFGICYYVGGQFTTNTSTVSAPIAV